MTEESPFNAVPTVPLVLVLAIVAIELTFTAAENGWVGGAQGVCQVRGMQGEAAISNGGLDANWMSAHGLPTVTIGCGQRDAHTVDESLHVPSFLNACQVGLLLATGTEATGN